MFMTSICNERGNKCPPLRVRQVMTWGPQGHIHCSPKCEDYVSVLVFFPSMQFSECVVYKLFGMVATACLQSLRKSCEELHPPMKSKNVLFLFLPPLHLSLLCTHRLWQFHFPECCCVSALELVSTNPLIVTPSITHTGRFSLYYSPITTHSHM